MNVRPTAVIVIAKTPAPGRVKTRLCPPCTPSEAAALAAAALADTLAAVQSSAASTRVLALDGPPGPWVPEGWVIVPQLGGGLDARLANAFAAVTGPALLVGMDTPQLTSGVVTDAIAALHEPGTDAVLGPARDGGYWAVGLQRADPRVFLGVPMSTAHTFADQVAQLASLGLRTRLLQTLRDVDTYEDAVAVAAANPSSRFSRTLAGLGRSVASAGA